MKKRIVCECTAIAVDVRKVETIRFLEDVVVVVEDVKDVEKIKAQVKKQVEKMMYNQIGFDIVKLDIEDFIITDRREYRGPIFNYGRA